MRTLVIGLLLLCGMTGRAVAKPSCGKGGSAGESVQTAGGGQYRISVPASYSATKAMPVLFALHGDEGTPDYIYAEFRELQKTAGSFILVAPKATSGGGSWYQAVAAHVTFVNEVIKDVQAKYNIDGDRLWITGWSGGSTFLGYYAVLREDILAGVVYHMGGGGGGGYQPPAGSCKIPARFVIGSQDFLRSLAKNQYDTMTAAGHETVWIEIPGLGHDFDVSQVPATWSWLQQKTLCGKTTSGSCDGEPPPPQPDAGTTPPPKADAGTKPPPASSDGGVPVINPDPGDAEGESELEVSSRLEGSCSVGRGAGLDGTGLVLLLLGALAGAGRLRRRQRLNAGGAMGPHLEASEQATARHTTEHPTRRKPVETVRHRRCIVKPCDRRLAMHFQQSAVMFLMMGLTIQPAVAGERVRARKPLEQRESHVLFRALRLGNLAMERARLQRHEDSKALGTILHKHYYGWSQGGGWHHPNGDWVNQQLEGKKISAEVLAGARAPGEFVTKKALFGSWTEWKDAATKQQRDALLTDLHDKAANRHPRVATVQSRMAAIEGELGKRMDAEYLGSRSAFSTALSSAPPEKLRAAAYKMIAELDQMVGSRDLRREDGGSLHVSSSSSHSSRGLLSSSHDSSSSSASMRLSQYIPETTFYQVPVGRRLSTMDGRKIAHTLADAHRIIRELEVRAPEMAAPLSHWLSSAKFEFAVHVDSPEKLAAWQDVPAAPKPTMVTVYAARAPKELGQLTPFGVLSPQVSASISADSRKGDQKLMVNPLLGE